MSCNSPNCSCEIDNEIQIRNDSILNIMDSLTIERGNYFEKYDEPMLQELDGKSYRLIDYSWMRNEAIIYRISKSKDRYYLYYRKIVKSENSYDDFGNKKDSINISSKIPLTDEFVTNLDSMFEANCFWGIPIIPHVSLDPVEYTLEISNPKFDECSKRSYHIVDLLSLDKNHESLDLICKEFVKAAEQ